MRECTRARALARDRPRCAKATAPSVRPACVRISLHPSFGWTRWRAVLAVLVAVGVVGPSASVWRKSACVRACVEIACKRSCST